MRIMLSWFNFGGFFVVLFCLVAIPHNGEVQFASRAYSMCTRRALYVFVRTCDNCVETHNTHEYSMKHRAALLFTIFAMKPTAP